MGGREGRQAGGKEGKERKGHKKKQILQVNQTLNLPLQCTQLSGTENVKTASKSAKQLR